MNWGFASSPKWIVRHVAVALLLAAMVLAGLWQLRRHGEKRDLRAVVHAREDLPPASVEEVVPPEGSDVDGIVYRRVTATGTYARADTFVVENRTYRGVSGAWVLTPLVLDDGSAVVVNRGFVGFDREGRIEAPPSPEREVAVEGVVLASQERGRFGPTDPDGKQAVLARVDLGRVQDQVGYPLRPAYVQLVRSDPAELGAGPEQPALVPVDPPAPDLGPHLGYAAQWAIFTTIAGVGYLLLLRKVAQDQANEERLAELPT